LRVLVDTSTWSAALRRSKAPPERSASVLADLISSEEELYLTGLILQEVLQAYRNELELNRVERYLRTVPLLALDRAGYVEAAGIYRRCASRGIGVSPTDCQIAAAAIRYECRLLTEDTDFEQISEVTVLELL
jgi:predicted nucleic acid-binding protein